MTDEIIIILYLLLGTGFFYFICKCIFPPDTYPSARYKWRIKKVTFKRGSPEYYIQYKWYFMWRTYEIWGGYDAECMGPLRFRDVDSAKAKITELIGDSQHTDGEKKDKVEYYSYYD